MIKFDGGPPLLHLIFYCIYYGWVDLVELKAMDNPRVRHAVIGLLVVYPRHRKILASSSAVFKKSLVQEKLILRSQASSSTPLLLLFHVAAFFKVISNDSSEQFIEGVKIGDWAIIVLEVSVFRFGD